MSRPEPEVALLAGQHLAPGQRDAMARWVAQAWPEAALMMLRVDDGNAAAIRAYEKAGWVDVGERRDGRVGLERTMSLRL